MWPVRQVRRQSGLMAELGEHHLWHSISQGVREARRAHGLKHPPVNADVAAPRTLPARRRRSSTSFARSVVPVRRSSTGEGRPG
jgi:hypothetical protein